MTKTSGIPDSNLNGDETKGINCISILGGFDSKFWRTLLLLDVMDLYYIL